MTLNKGKIYSVTLVKAGGDTTIVSSSGIISNTSNYITLQKSNETTYTLSVGNTTSTSLSLTFTVVDNRSNNIQKTANFDIV